MSGDGFGGAPLPEVATHVSCEKCSGDDIFVRYHAQGCHRDECSCNSCLPGSIHRRHDEHLHSTCRRCGFDWTGEIWAPAEKRVG